ncbi:MAG: replicative helicase [Actinomycetota bacterium]|jgi:replicative DNA helicase
MTDTFSNRGAGSNSGADGRGKRSAPTRPMGPDRVPPHNLSAEESLLGALLLSREAVNTVGELGMQADVFYKPAHQHVYDAMRNLMGSGQPVDAVTVADEIRKVGLLDDIGGMDFLLRLQNSTPVIGNVGRYAKIVMDTAALRRLIGVASEIAEIAYSEPDDVSKALDTAESKVFEVADDRVVDSVAEIRDVLRLTTDELERRYTEKAGITGVATGFVDLDEKLLGLQPASLVILGARPAMGKSALALNIATYVAKNTRQPVLVFSLEMSHSEMAQRILSAEAKVDTKKLRTGSLTGNEWSDVNNAVGRLEVPLFLDDNPAVNVMEIRAKARRLKSRFGQIGLIVIDYLQLMEGRGRSENRQLEVSEISRNLKVLARELDVPILALSQLSRRLEERSDKVPQLSDLRESGSLEQDADVVLFLHREEVYKQDSIDPSLRGMATLHIAKHRAGEIGKVTLVFQGEYSLFRSAARGITSRPDPVGEAI